jgi:chromosome segregation ATPase
MPKPEDTTGNTEGESTENENNSSTTPPEGENQTEPKGSKPSAKTYSEAEYKGLQAVIAKRDELIKNKDDKIAELIAKLAEAEANHGSAVSEKSTLTQKLTDATSQVETLQKQLADKEKNLKFQKIVMTDFTELAPVIDLIPDAENEEEFRAKAKEVQTTLSRYIGNGVKQVLSGSSPALSGDDEGSTLGADEEDRLYRNAVKLAGIPGKEAEYEVEYQKYLDFKKSHKSA